MAHIVQALTRMDENATLLSIDGVGAHDSISRRAMFRCFAGMSDGEKVIPFVTQCCDSPSSFLLEDEKGDARTVRQISTERWLFKQCRLPSWEDRTDFFTLEKEFRERLPEAVVWRGDQDTRNESPRGVHQSAVEVVREDARGGRRPSGVTTLEFLRGHTFQLLVEDCPPRLDGRVCR